MYLDHYHLKAKPFDLSPGPRFLWLGEKHKEALSTLIYGISEDLGFLLLTGDVGVGKTALIHRLINNLDASTIVAHITDPGLGINDFFKLLAAEFNIDSGFHGKGEFLLELEKFLYAAYSDRKKVLLIVDEAQRLNNKLLDQIRVLSNIELSDRKLINIFFVGQPEFKKMLMADSNRAIRQRIAINYHISPLTESETGQYIDHRLKVAGATRKIFKSNAIREIFRFTGGFPRAINVICDHALLTGYASGIQSIDADVIKECEQELNIRAGFNFGNTAFQPANDTTRPETSQPPPRRTLSMGVPVIIGLFVVLGALAGYYFLWPAPRWKTTPPPPARLADASSQQMGTVEKVPNQAPSQKEIALSQTHKVDDAQEKPVPEDQTTAAVPPPAVAKAQDSPAPGRSADNRGGDGGATSTGKAEKASALLSTSSGPETDMQSEKATPGADTDNQPLSETKAKTADSDRQPAVFTSQASPAPDPIPYIGKKDSRASLPANTVPDSTMVAASAAEAATETQTATADTPPVDGPVTAAGKAAAAVVAVLAAEPDPIVDPTPRSEAVVRVTPPTRQTATGAEDQPTTPVVQTAPAAPSTAPPPVDRAGATPGETEAEKAVTAVPAAAKPTQAPKVDPAPRKETITREAQPSRKADPGAGGQPSAPTTQAAVESTPPTDTLGVENDATAAGKAVGDQSLLAVIAAEPSPAASPGPSVGNTGAKPAANRSTSVNTPSQRTAESQRPTGVSPSPPTAGPAPSAEGAPSGNLPEATLSAKVDTQLPSLSEDTGRPASASVQADAVDMENRLRTFLQTYCRTYAAKDIDRFTGFFSTDAMENGKPFDSLVPKYERNFKFIETIEYRIELQDFAVTEGQPIITVDGDFFLRWLPPDKQWRENSGTISMRLIDNGSTFLVQRLDYQGGGSSKN